MLLTKRKTTRKQPITVKYVSHFNPFVLGAGAVDLIWRRRRQCGAAQRQRFSLNSWSITDRLWADGSVYRQLRVNNASAKCVNQQRTRRVMLGDESGECGPPRIKLSSISCCCSVIAAKSDRAAQPCSALSRREVLQTADSNLSQLLYLSV